MENVLIIGGGGREHAIALKLKQSPNLGDLYCIPGNAGIAEIATCRPDISVMDFKAIGDYIDTIGTIDMVVVSPDDPLAKGLVDFLNEKGIRAFGPTAAAAQMEASKSYAKEFMLRHGIPTAKYAVFTDFRSAMDYVRTQPHPIVIKADGLAAGKGVIITQTMAESVAVLKEILEDSHFGNAGAKVVIEECMVGKEVSILAFTDGRTIVPMVSSQDHKRAFDGDKGPNTGGMGAFSPSHAYTQAVAQDFREHILIPTFRGFQQDGIKFKGVLYFGLMITAEGVKVVEYNARFGDPETQVVLPRLKTDLLEVFDAVIDERLSEIKFEWDPRSAVCVVLAAAGYPVAYEKGMAIAMNNPENVTIYHAGTKMFGNELVAWGGRIMGVTALAPSIEEARKIAYTAVSRINFEQKHMRTDIGTNL